MSAEVDVLRSTLERVLSSYFSKSCRIANIRTRHFPRQSSFQIREVELILEDGRRLEILWKNTGRRGILDGAANVRLRNPEDPRCELETYTTLLQSGLGPPACYGTVMDVEQGEYWLFLEKVNGFPLSETGELSTWMSVARWLALFQRNCPIPPGRLDWLTKYDADYYRTWADRSLEVVSSFRERRRGQELRCFERLLAQNDRLTAQLINQPQAVIHGEFYAANVLVAPKESGGVRVCPVDWGTTAIGPALVDVAALVSGGWSESERTEIAQAYRDSAFPDLPWREFTHRLNQCRMHIAIKWVGWCPGWRPPKEQAYDWLAEACRLAKQLGLV